VVEEKIADKKDSDFQNAWMSRSVTAEVNNPAKKISPVQRSLEEIKQFAYEAFDRLDKNGNGFIETDELSSFLEDANTPMREKSFITFLLTNQQEISEACKEDGSMPSTGISRLDLEFYFRLIIGQLKS
jgi:hypothetical protein